MTIPDLDEVKQSEIKASFEHLLDVAQPESIGGSIHFEILEPHHIARLVALYSGDLNVPGGKDDMYSRFLQYMDAQRFEKYLENLSKDPHSIAIVSFDQNGDITGMGEMKPCCEKKLNVGESVERDEYLETEMFRDGDDHEDSVETTSEGVFEYGVLVFSGSRGEGYGSKITSLMLALGILSGDIDEVRIDVLSGNMPLFTMLRKVKSKFQYFELDLDFVDIPDRKGEIDYQVKHRRFDCNAFRQIPGWEGRLRALVDSLYKEE